MHILSSMCPRFYINLGSDACVHNMRIEAKLSRETNSATESGREKARVGGYGGKHSQ